MKHKAVMAHGEVEVGAPPFLISALDGREYSGKSDHYPLGSRFSEFQRLRKFLFENVFNKYVNPV
jgi:hypothetical protein